MIPSFKIGDIVCYDDDFGFHKEEKALTIGKIQAVHIISGRLMTREGLKTTNESMPYIVYSISGIEKRITENWLRPYKENT